MTALDTHVQKLELGALVNLFTLDATALGGTISRWTPGPLNGSVVLFDGEVYLPVPIEGDGWEYNSRGALPTPKVRVANINNLLTGSIQSYKDLVGATLTRIRTFEKFLDAGSDPDPLAIFQPDVFRIERKVTQNKIYVEFELSAVLDQEGVSLPGRQVLRDACTHRYRRWNFITMTFDYTNATCPYTGGLSFTETAVPTGDSGDVCGKKLSDCKLRFGANAVLPTRAFPGVARIR